MYVAYKKCTPQIFGNIRSLILSIPHAAVLPGDRYGRKAELETENK